MQALGLADAPVLGHQRARIDLAQRHLTQGRPQGERPGEIGNLKPAAQRWRADHIRKVRIDIFQLDPAEPGSGDDFVFAYLDFLRPGVTPTGFAQGEFQTRRNFDPRFFPPPLTTLQCGAVVIIELTGELFLPFRSGFSGCETSFNPPADGLLPAFLNIDGVSAALIPGFYGIKLSIRN